MKNKRRVISFHKIVEKYYYPSSSSMKKPEEHNEKEAHVSIQVGRKC